MIMARIIATGRTMATARSIATSRVLATGRDSEITEGDPGGGNGLLTSLVAHWSLDGNPNDPVNGLHLTEVNSPTYQAAKLSQGAALSGETQQHFTSDSALLILPDGNWSFAGWVKLTDVLSTNAILSSTPADPISLDAMLRYDAGEWIYAACGSVFASGVSALVDTWYFIVLQRASNVLQLWVDGVMVASELLSPVAGTANAVFHLGRDAYDGYSSYGVFDSWDYRAVALTSDQIAILYNSGNGLAYDSYTS
jgi:hypothetical protein